jgi:hypothetical protein
MGLRKIKWSKNEIVIDESANQHKMKLSLGLIPQDLLALCPNKIIHREGKRFPYCGIQMSIAR